MIFTIKKKFVCVFCNEKKDIDKAVFFSGVNGFCRECADKIEYTTGIDCFEGTENIDYMLAPLFYSGAVKDAIQRYKFKDFSGYGNVFYYIMQEYIEKYEHLRDFDAVIPVPISPGRMRERGFNQSLILAKAVSDILNVPLRSDMLKKVRETQRQSLLKAHERNLNVKNAYWADIWLFDKKVILVDDIFTTGTTMEECAATIKKDGKGTIVGVSLAARIAKKEIFNV